MRSIFVLLILVMIGLNGKGQSVTALPDSVLSQCCLEVTLLNGNVTTVDWVFIQYITRDGTGTKLFVEYAPNFGGIQWETQIRIQDDFDEVIERSKFIILPFTVGSTDYGIHRNWIANIEENTTTGGTWIYGRFGTPTKRKFSAVEDYETLKALLLACHPRAIVVAENGLYTEGDTVRMGGFLIENTTVSTGTYSLTLGRISGTSYSYHSVFGSGVYSGIYSNSPTAEVDLTIGNGLFGFEQNDGSNSAHLTGTKYGVQMDYSGTYGTTSFKMDSAYFKISGLPSYADHTAAEAALFSNTLYLLNGDRAIYINSGSTTTPYISGSGTTNYIPKFTGAQSIGNSNLTDDNTVVSILNNKPFLLGQWTTAGRPSGTTSYSGWNTTLGGEESYDGTRWNSTPRASKSAFTSGSVIFANSSTQLDEDNTNFFYNYSLFNLRLGPSAAADRAELGAANGSGQPYLRLFNSGLSDAILTNNATGRFGMNVGLDVTGSITATSNFKSVGLASIGSSATGGNALGGELILRPNGGSPAFINFTENGAAFWANMGVDNTNGDLKYETSPTSDIAWETGTTRLVLKQNGRLGIGASTTVNYSLEQTGQTDAFGLARGGTATRPTIASSTTPLRYNTDLALLEYGTAPSTWTSIALGSVTSVGLSLPSIFSVSGSPVTTSGTLSATFTGGNTRQVLRGDGIWANTLDSFRINQSLASVESFEVNGNIVLNRGSGSNKLILTRNWSQEISAGGSNGNMNFVNGSGPGFQNYFILGTVAGIDTMVTIHYDGLGVAVGKSNKLQARLHVKGIGTTTGKTMLLEDSGGADILTVTDNKVVQFNGYGTSATTAVALSKTLTNYGVGFATDGTVTSREIKRDTTIYVTDADYNFSAALTTAQINSRYNRIIIFMTCSSSAADHNTLTMHTPDSNLAQCEIVVYSIDDNPTYRNDITFGTSNLISPTGSLNTTYNLSGGQWLHVRVADVSGYKYFISY